MFKLRIGYAITGIATGLVLLISFIATLPDGKLHLVFCDVGQGDAAYVRFPDGRDLLVDAGPNDNVLGCLGKHMPFWDRTINIVVLTHPQKDHMQGLISVFERYSVDYFVRSEVANDTEGYKQLMALVEQKKIRQRFVTAGERVAVGNTSLTVLWPSEEQVAKDMGELNDYSVVLWVRYGDFDAILTGDADTHVEEKYRGQQALGTIELLKVPHHGSKTGMSEAFLDWLKPQLAIISVGKNSYGHPTKEILELLQRNNVRTLRTDEAGDIEIVSDGRQMVLH